MSFISSVIFTYSSKIVSIMFLFATNIIIAKSLGPEGLGIIEVVMVVVGIAIQFGHLGLPNSIIYHTSKYPDELDKIITILMFVGLCSGFFLAIITGTILFVVPSIVKGIDLCFFYLALCSIPFAISYQHLQNVFIGIKKLYQYNLLDIANKLIICIFTFIVLVVFHFGIVSVIIIQVVGTMVIFSVAVYFVSRIRPLSRFLSIQLLREMLKFGFILYLGTVIAYCVLRSDILLANYYLNAYSVGIYSVAVKISDLILVLPAVIGMLLVPHLISNNATNSEEISSKVIRIFIFIMAIICCVIGLFSQQFIVFIYGPTFIDSSMLLLVLLPGIFFLSIQQIGCYYLIAMKDFRFIPLYWLMALLINVGINIILLPSIGIIGASISSSLAYGIMLLAVLTHIIRKSNIKPNKWLIIEREDFQLLYCYIKHLHKS